MRDNNRYLIFLLLCICTLVSSIAFIQHQQNSHSPEQQIVGTWIPEGGSSSNRWVIKENGTLDRYYKDDIYKTYSWTIEAAQTPSGLTHHELILTNTQNSDDVTKYLIDTLTDERMVLVYNTGIGMSRSTYIRQ